MVFTRRMTKERANTQGGFNMTTAETVQSSTFNKHPTRAIVCQDVVRGVVGISGTAMSRVAESSAAPKLHVPTENSSGLCVETHVIPTTLARRTTRAGKKKERGDTCASATPVVRESRVQIDPRYDIRQNVGASEASSSNISATARTSCKLRSSRVRQIRQEKTNADQKNKDSQPVKKGRSTDAPASPKGYAALPAKSKRKRGDDSNTDESTNSPIDRSPTTRRTRRRVEMVVVDPSAPGTRPRRSARTKRPTERAARALANQEAGRNFQSVQSEKKSLQNITSACAAESPVRETKRRYRDVIIEEPNAAEGANHSCQKKRKVEPTAAKKRCTAKKSRSQTRGIDRCPSPVAVVHSSSNGTESLKLMNDFTQSAVRSALTDEDLNADLAEGTSFAPSSPISSIHDAESLSTVYERRDVEISSDNPPTLQEAHSPPVVTSAELWDSSQGAAHQFTDSTNNNAYLTYAGIPHEPEEEFVSEPSDTREAKEVDDVSHRYEVTDEDEQISSVGKPEPFASQALQVPASTKKSDDKDESAFHGVSNDEPRISGLRTLFTQTRNLLGGIAGRFSFRKGHESQDVASPPVSVSVPQTPTPPPVTNASQTKPIEVIDLTGSSPERPAFPPRRRRRGPIVIQRRHRRVAQVNTYSDGYRSPPPDAFGRQKLAPEPPDELMDALRA